MISTAFVDIIFTVSFTPSLEKIVKNRYSRAINQLNTKDKNEANIKTLR